jgi:hypothetical protein
MVVVVILPHCRVVVVVVLSKVVQQCSPLVLNVVVVVLPKVESRSVGELLCVMQMSESWGAVP